MTEPRSETTYERMAREAEEWEQRWKREARQSLSESTETEAWRIARYALVGRTPLDRDAATTLSRAYLQLLNEVGRAGV